MLLGDKIRETWAIQESCSHRDNTMFIEKVCLPRYLFRYVTNTLCYLRNVLGVDAVYGVAHVLPGRHQQREGEARHHRDRLQQRGSVVIGDIFAGILT